MAKYKSEFELGEKARDNYTGFRGTITAICFYIDGEMSYCIESYNVDKPHKEWVSVNRLVKDW